MTPEMLDSIIADLCNSPDLKFSQRYALQSLRKDRNDLQSQLAAANERADGLQRIVDEARAQKPVCITTLDDFCTVVAYPPPNVLHSVPLYAAAPVPAQPAVVPEVVREFSELHERHVYAIRTKNRDSAAYSCAGQLFEKRGNFLLALASPHTISAESFKLHYEALKVALPTWPDAILSTTDTEGRKDE